VAVHCALSTAPQGLGQTFAVQAGSRHDECKWGRGGQSEPVSGSVLVASQILRLVQSKTCMRIFLMGREIGCVLPAAQHAGRELELVAFVRRQLFQRSALVRRLGAGLL
jgi:hypothetical protein